MLNSTLSIKDFVNICKKPLHLLRAIILVMLLYGFKITFISLFTGIHRSTIFRLREKYKVESNPNFADRPRSGAPRKLTKSLEQQLLIVYQTPPRVFGYAQNYWTSNLLCEHMYITTGIKVSISTIWRVLKRNGFSCHRPKQRIRSPDPEYAKKLEKIEQILKKTPKGAVVLYVDEHNAHLNPSIRRCLQKRGDQIKVYTPGQNKKLYVFAAYCPFKKRIVIWEIFKSKRSEEFFEFLKSIVKKFKNKSQIILILDNYIIHKSKKLQKLLQDNTNISRKIQFVWLPTYAPELNPLERVWGTIKAHAESNYSFKDENEFRDALNATLIAVATKKVAVHEPSYKQVLVLQHQK